MATLEVRVGMWNKLVANLGHEENCFCRRVDEMDGLFAILCFDLVWISSDDLLFLRSSTLHRSVRLLASFAWLREEKAGISHGRT